MDLQTAKILNDPNEFVKWCKSNVFAQIKSNGVNVVKIDYKLDEDVDEGILVWLNPEVDTIDMMFNRVYETVLWISGKTGFDRIC